jgi:hypothetical protein
MTSGTVKLQIPFESLLDAIDNLHLEEKRRLWRLLDEEIRKAEENLSEEDSYDWGSNGQPQGKPIEYIPGVGLTVVGSKDAAT